MAGVRNFPTVVYDVVHFLDDPQLKTADSSAWLVRSFRVAEQFVLTRAVAVVVHQAATAEAAIQRGAAKSDVFVVPRPADIPADPHPDYDWIRTLGLAKGAVTFFAPEIVITRRTPAVELAPLLEVGRGSTGVLLLACEPGAEGVARGLAAPHGVAAVAIPVEQMDRALRSADVVIAGLRASTEAQAAVGALANRRALLAADTPEHRDITPEGRGCLWFNVNDARDLATRAAFLADNAEFRRALAASGHAHLLETRGAAAIAAQYDAVYRHAFTRRREPRTPIPNLLPARAAL
jgi:glycosyltransferase involved in cell wall biosynthesis